MESRDEERMRRAAEQEKRALEALESIMAGGDLGHETLALSNEFTDRHTARAKAWFGGLFRRHAEDLGPGTDIGPGADSGPTEGRDRQR